MGDQDEKYDRRQSSCVLTFAIAAMIVLIIVMIWVGLT